MIWKNNRVGVAERGPAFKSCYRKRLLSTQTHSGCWSGENRKWKGCFCDGRAPTLWKCFSHSRSYRKVQIFVMFPLWVVPLVLAGICPSGLWLTGLLVCRTVAGTGPALCFSAFCAHSSSLRVLLLIPALIWLQVFAVQRLWPPGWLGAVVLGSGAKRESLGRRLWTCRRTLLGIQVVADINMFVCGENSTGKRTVKKGSAVPKFLLCLRKNNMYREAPWLRLSVSYIWTQSPWIPDGDASLIRVATRTRWEGATAYLNRDT